MSSNVDGILASRDYTGRDFSAIQADLLRFIEATRPAELNSFFEGDVAKILIELIAYEGDGLSYGIDRVGEEAFLATCRIFDSALRHARTVAYQVSTVNGASVTLVPGSYATIPDEIKDVSLANEQQTITLSGNPVDGTFTITFDGETSLPIAYDASSVDMKDALEAVSTIGAGNVSVTGASGGPWVVTFISDLAYAAQTDMTGASVDLERNEIQTIVFGAVPTSGDYALAFNGGAEVTSTIQYDDVAATVQGYLEALASIGAGNVTVTGNTTSGFTVEFVGSLANASQELLTVDSNTLDAGGAVSITVDEDQDGDAQTVDVTEDVAGFDDSYTVTFPAGTQFSVGNQPWEVTEDTTISPESVTSSEYQTAFEVPVSAGASFSESFSSTGRSFQTFTTSATDVIEGSFFLYVGGADGDLWSRIDSIALAAPTDNVYELRFDPDGRAIFTFGNGITGAIPTNGQVVYVVGRFGGGADSNIGAGGIVASLSGTATNANGVSIPVTVSMTNIVAATGGRDRETLDDIKRNIPAYIRTVDKAITREDYGTLAAQYESSNGSVSRAVAYLETGTILHQISGDPISSVNPLSVEQGTQITLDGRVFELSKDLYTEIDEPILFVNPNLVLVYTWSAGLSGFEASSEVIRDEVLAYLQDRSVITTTIRVLPGETSSIDIDLGTVYYFNSYDPSDVQDAIKAAAVAYFLGATTQPGTSFRVSDFYAAIEAVSGVNYFHVESPSQDVAVAKNEIAVLGNLTFSLEVTTAPVDEDVNRQLFNDKLYNGG